METLNGLPESETLDRCEQVLGYKFRDRSLMEAALTHASGANRRLESNERLEFLGDAVLAVVVCDDLYHKHPRSLEGELTKIKSAVVSRRICAKVSRSLGLGEMLFLGKGMMTRSTLPMSLLAAVFEALIGAVYLDGGFAAAQDLVLRLIRPVMDELRESRSHRNYKSQLQQYAQGQEYLTPVYELLDEQGPDHSKCFETCVRLGKRRFPSAWGPNKKEAEQQAAKRALIILGLLQIDLDDAD